MTAKIAKAKPFALSDFFTVPGASAGRQLPLTLPDGTATDQHLVVLGVDSPVARQALLDAGRMIRDERKESMTDDEKTAINDRANLALRSALVVGWSFPDAFSADAVRDLLINSPGLAIEVEQFAGDRARFFANKSAAS